MKIWFTLLVLMLVGNCYAINKYVSTIGNDANSGNSPAAAYLTFPKASLNAVNPGDSIIFLAGTFNVANVQVVIQPGVSIRGAGSFAGGTKIILTYSFPGGGFNVFNNAAVQLSSNIQNTNGNQSITKIWFDGNNFGCLAGALVRARGNVIFQNCKFTNFGITAINFNGKTGQGTGTPPAIFSNGNKVLNCSFFECSDRITQQANSVSCGSISYAGQINILFQSDTLSNTTKPQGHNGNLFGAVQGNNIGAKWISCIMNKPPDEGASYNFGIESWYDQGGCEIAFCTYVGGGNFLDVGYGGANRGDSLHSWNCHDNNFPNPALLTSAQNLANVTAGSFVTGKAYMIKSVGTTNFTAIGAGSNTVGVIFTATGPGTGTGTGNASHPTENIIFQFEPSTNTANRPINATIGDALIQYNHCNRVGTFIQITLNNFAQDFVKNIQVDHNDGNKMGYTNNTYSAVFNYVLSNGVVIDSINMYNNTFVSVNGVGSEKAIVILQPNVGTISHINFINNIADSALGYGYLVFRGNNATNFVTAKNNITFQNAFTNNPFTLLTTFVAGTFVVGKQYTIANIGNTNFVAIGASSNTVGVVFTASGVGSGTGSATGVITPQNFTNTGNIKADPLFVSTTDLHLAAGSPGISGGLSPPNYVSTPYYIGAFPPGTITPTITWTNPADIVYGTALSGTQLNATSGGVPGTFVYTPAAGTILNAGLGQALSVTFTPTDQVTYSVVSKQVTINVTKATATLAYSNLTQTYTGSQLSPTVTTTPAGLTVVSTTYNGVGTAPTNAGTYAIVSGLTNANYTAATISGTFTINKATATINASNLTQTYDGTQKSVIATTTPVGLTGLAATYNGSATPPTNAGTYPLVITLTNANYTAPNFNGTFTISKATPTVSWSNPAAITYGTALSGTQLNATASVAGTFTYTPAAGTVLNAGTQTLSVDFTPSDAVNYNSVNGTTVTIVVNQATATLSLSNLNQVYDGLGKTVTVTSNPVGLGTISITYNGSILAPVNAGSYAIVATLSNSNYTATPATGTLIISKATAILSVSNTVQTYNGSQRSVTVSTVPAGLNTISILYNGSPTSQTNAGTYTVDVSLSNANYDADPISTTLTINKATPVITWGNPVAITYGTPLSGTQLNATSNVVGTFVYTPPSGTILNAGTYTLITDFTPTDAVNYNSVNGTSVTLVVNKATAIIILSNLNQDYDGNPKPITVVTSPLGLATITVLYNGSPTPPSAVGSYPLNVTLSNTNYQATPATGTLVISMPVGNVAITNINQTYTGSTLSVTVTTSPGTYPVTVTYNGFSTPPTNSGAYTTIATINDGVHVGSDTAIFVILKANPVINWSNPSAINYPTPLSVTQLNANSTVSGTFTYSPVIGTVLNAGTEILSVGFTPTDAANYNSIPSTTVTLIINKGTATISTSNTNQPFDGNPKPVTVTTSPIGLSSISTTYNGSGTPPSAIGTYQVISNLNNSNYSAKADTVTLTITTTSAGISISNLLQVYTGSPLPVTVTTNPNGLSYTVTYNGGGVKTNAGTYTVIATLNDGIHTGADTQTLVISKATPIITWGNPASITYGTPLSGTQLNATVNAAGGLVYSPVAGTILNVGNQSLLVTFTPTDAANYNSVIKIVPITVLGSGSTLNLSNLSQSYNGLPRSVVVTTTPSGLSGVTVTYNGSPSIPVNAGTYAIHVTLVNDNYTATPVDGTLIVAKINAVLSWTTPVAIPLGTPLTATQLNATANIAGTFTYSPGIGTALPEGVTGVVATLHPTDSVNYNSTTIQVPITVFGNPLQLWYIITGNPDYQNLPGQNIIFPY